MTVTIDFTRDELFTIYHGAIEGSLSSLMTIRSDGNSLTKPVDETRHTTSDLRTAYTRISSDNKDIIRSITFGKNMRHGSDADLAVGVSKETVEIVLNSTIIREGFEPDLVVKDVAAATNVDNTTLSSCKSRTETKAESKVTQEVSGKVDLKALRGLNRLTVPIHVSSNVEKTVNLGETLEALVNERVDTVQIAQVTSDVMHTVKSFRADLLNLFLALLGAIFSTVSHDDSSTKAGKLNSDATSDTSATASHDVNLAFLVRLQIAGCGGHDVSCDQAADEHKSQ